jgi:phage-related protein
VKANNNRTAIIAIAKYLKMRSKVMSQKTTYTPITAIGHGCQNLNKHKKSGALRRFFYAYLLEDYLAQ